MASSLPDCSLRTVNDNSKQIINEACLDVSPASAKPCGDLKLDDRNCGPRSIFTWPGRASRVAWNRLGNAKEHPMVTPAHAPTIEERLFADDGRVPNNPRLPLIVYRGALTTGPGAAAACEARFAGNG